MDNIQGHCTYGQLSVVRYFCILVCNLPIRSLQILTWSHRPVMTKFEQGYTQSFFLGTVRRHIRLVWCRLRQKNRKCIGCTWAMLYISMNNEINKKNKPVNLVWIELLLVAIETDIHQPRVFYQARIEFLTDVSKKPLYIFCIKALEQNIRQFSLRLHSSRDWVHRTTLVIVRETM